MDEHTAGSPLGDLYLDNLVVEYLIQEDINQNITKDVKVTIRDVLWESLEVGRSGAIITDGALND